jgi:hypothetical protein
MTQEEIHASSGICAGVNVPPRPTSDD